jgi:hypothetical protein
MGQNIAHIPLDFAPEQSVSGVHQGARMDQSTARFTIRMLLIEIRRTLEAAASTAKAAETCAETGNIKSGISVAHEIEQPVYEAGRLLDAGLINRLSKEE